MQIGNATRAWAVLEVQMDLANWAIANRLPKREPFPLNLGRKLDLFKRGHNQLAELSKLRSDGTALASDIAILSVKRHDVIHGYALNGLSEKSITLRRHTVPRGGDKNHELQIHEKTYARREFFSLASETLELCQRMSTHLDAVIVALGADDLVDDLLRKRTVGHA